jgi:energy-coupling factor transporter ATP-binding protein EcfA2
MARDSGLLTGSKVVATRPEGLSAATREQAMQPSRGVVEITGLGRRFGDHEVVRSLDLSLAPGERAAFWGPNGSGKSTVLRCIAGTLLPSSGRILVNGFPAGTLEARRAVGASLAQAPPDELVPVEEAACEDCRAGLVLCDRSGPAERRNELERAVPSAAILSVCSEERPRKVADRVDVRFEVKGGHRG